MSSMKCLERPSLLSIAGLTVLAMLMVVPGASAQGTKPPPLNFQLSAGFQIPPADQQCILPGQRLNLQCVIANDPDFKRVRAEEAMLEAQALAAAKSGQLDPYHQVETLGKLEIFDPKLVREQESCLQLLPRPRGRLCKWRIDLERIHRRIEPGIGSHHRPRSLS